MKVKWNHGAKCGYVLHILANTHLHLQQPAQIF